MNMITQLDKMLWELKKELLCCIPALRPKKILFDHLPKCGGTSIMQYIAIHYPARKIYFINGRDSAASVKKFKTLTQKERHNYDFITGHHAKELLEHVSPESLKITVFREPVDRIVSHFYYAKRTEKHYLHSKIRETGMGLEEYATSGLSPELRNWYTTYFSGMNADDVEKNPEESVAKAVDFVLKNYDIASFIDDIESFANELQIKANLRYKFKKIRANAAPDRLSINNISQSVLERIREVNFIDIDFYMKMRKEKSERI